MLNTVGEASGERSEKSIKQQEKYLKEMRENDRDLTFRELADREREKDHKD